MSSLPPDEMPRSHQAIAVLWPSFIAAIVASGIFFSAFDPRDLLPFNLDTELSPLGRTRFPEFCPAVSRASCWAALLPVACLEFWLAIRRSARPQAKLQLVPLV